MITTFFWMRPQIWILFWDSSLFSSLWLVSHQIYIFSQTGNHPLFLGPPMFLSTQVQLSVSKSHVFCQVIITKKKINIFSSILFFFFFFFLKWKTKADPETLELWNKLGLMGVIMTGSEIQWAVFDMWKTECHLLYVLLSLMWWVKLCLSPAPCFYFNNVVQQILNLTLQNGSAHSKMTHVVSDLPSLFLTYGYIKAANSFWSKYLSAKTKSLFRANFPQEQILLRDNI